MSGADIGLASDAVQAAAHSWLSIAHVHTGLVGSGGDRVSELEACYLAAQGHRATMIGPTAAPIAARLAVCGVGIIDDQLAERDAERVLARTGPLDLVHCHCILSAPFASALARASGAALLVHVHSMGEEWWECSGRLSALSPQRRRLRREIDEAVGSASLVLCVSEAVRDHMKAIGLPIRRAEIIRNPIDDIFFRDQAPQTPVFDVAILARPSRAKSPLTALRILAEARRLKPDLSMVWIGPLGKWGPLLYGAARLLGLDDRLHFAGALPPAGVCDLLDRTRILLSASNREGQPLSVLEGLARDCSALLSDIPSHRQFAAHNGVRFFPLKQPEQAARVLVELAESYSRPGRAVLAEHQVEVHGRRLLDHYRSILIRGGNGEKPS
jgi:glycosyltransferase involved in cell wall biosynthesis